MAHPSIAAGPSHRPAIGPGAGTPFALTVSVQTRITQVLEVTGTPLVLRAHGRTAYLHLNPCHWDPESSAWVSSGFRGRPDIAVGFAAVIVEPDRVRLVAGDRHEVPLAHTRSGASVTAGTCLRRLTHLLPEAPPLDSGTLVASLFGSTGTATHLHKVHRVPFGASAVIAAGAPTCFVAAHRPSVDQDLPGEADTRVMGAAVRDAVVDSSTSGPSAVAMSGGLDSTILASVSAAANSGRTVAVSHVPRFRSGVKRPGWVEDELSHILSVGQHVRGLDLHIVASPPETMLNHLPDAFERTYSPVLNPSALTWMRSLAGAAAAIGADSLMVGQAGNATFSRGRMSRRPPWGRLRGVARHLVDPLRGRTTTPYNRWFRSGLREEWVPPRPAPPADHAESIRRYASSGSPLPFSRTAYTSGLPISDPLSDRRVVQSALAMSDDSWTRDGYDRSLARRCGRSLLPDMVRLRPEKGAQGADQWVFRTAAQREFLAAVDRVASSSGAREVVDIDRLHRSVAGWPGHSPREHMAWDATGGRILALGLFIAWWEESVEASPAGSSR